MKINFFDWIREGVRQSVLLGLSDAASDIGSAKDVEVLNQQFLSSIQQGASRSSRASQPKDAVKR